MSKVTRFTISETEYDILNELQNYINENDKVIELNMWHNVKENGTVYVESCELRIFNAQLWKRFQSKFKFLSDGSYKVAQKKPAKNTLILEDPPESIQKAWDSDKENDERYYKTDITTGCCEDNCNGTVDGEGLFDPVTEEFVKFYWMECRKCDWNQYS